VYGFVFMVNRVEADPTDVLVDRWPDFNVLFIRPQRLEKADLFKDMCIFTKDETSLRSLLIRADIFDWKQYFCLSVDVCHVELIRSIAANRGVPNIRNHVCHMMILQDLSKLTMERVWVAGAPAHDRYPKHIAPDPYAPSCGWWAYGKVGLRRFFGLCPAESRRQRLGHQALACVPQPQAWLQGGAPVTPVRATSHLRVSSLNESHVALVNSTWKFGCGDLSDRFIREMIMNYPSCCVLDSEGRPVSWILTYASGAMGMLYTLPEYRQKGYAKALVKTLAKKLHSEGYPVYCFIELENQASYRLFTSLGFTADPSYRATWFECDQ
ncbi:hypothetical protein QTP70_017454, partial [Hemibagrus guttatus]